MSPAKKTEAPDLTAHRRAHWRAHLRVLSSRPRLVIAGGLGLAAGLFAAFGLHLRLSASGIAGWDTFCLVFLGLCWGLLSRQGPDEIRRKSARQDEGQAAILTIVLGACLISLAATAMELSIAKSEHGLARALHVLSAVGTVAASWMVMQVILALHYAHEYYARDAKTGKDVGGLAFQGGKPPDYWDFVHFSIVIGVAAQTADIAFTDRRLRRLGTLHSILAFVFNTLILALTVNLAASLF